MNKPIRMDIPADVSCLLVILNYGFSITVLIRAKYYQLHLIFL